MSWSRDPIRKAAFDLFARKGTTLLNVSELAHAAGVARGTVYNNVAESDRLFEEFASGMAGEMFDRTAATMAAETDPVRRMAGGMRLFVRRAHEEPEWGRFLIRFALAETQLGALLFEMPAHDLRAGVAAGVFHVEPGQIEGAVALIAGSTLGAIVSVNEGQQGWRAAGSTNAQFVLRAFGVDPEAARDAASAPLPPLAPDARHSETRDRVPRRSPGDRQ